MARSALSFSLLLTLLSFSCTAVFIPPPPPLCCPTITKTTSAPYCRALTSLSCVQPECIILNKIDNPCACPIIVPTSTVYTACPTACHGGCGTAYQTIRNCFSSPSPNITVKSTTTTTTTTTPTVSCVTVTDTTGSACPKNTNFCTTAECIELKTVTQNCGCSSIYHATSCKTTCDLSCATAYSTVYLPCPARPPVVTGGPVTVPDY